MNKSSRSTVEEINENTRNYFEKTKYYGPSNTLFEAVLYLNNYKRKALDVGCGALRDSKFLSNCGFIVDAIDNKPEAKEYTVFFKYRPKNTFNLIVADYNNYDLGENKYEIINAQNTLSFNTKLKVKKLIEKIYSALKKGGYFSGNFFGPNDSWAKEEDLKMSFYTLEETKKLLNKFKVKKISEVEEDGESVSGNKKHSHIINFVVKK